MSESLLTIRDRDGPHTFVDSEYVALGVAEGWLKVNRVYKNYLGRVVIEYILQ